MSNTSRRRLLKSIAAGGGAVLAGKSLPESWTNPVVESVLMPAHAQTSCSNVVQIPSNAQTNVDDSNGIDLVFWYCSPGSYTNNSGIELTIFVDEGVNLFSNSGVEDTFYVKSGASLSFNSGLDHTIYAEPGANVDTSNAVNVSVIETCITFDTSNAPSCT